MHNRLSSGRCVSAPPLIVFQYSRASVPATTSSHGVSLSGLLERIDPSLPATSWIHHDPTKMAEVGLVFRPYRRMWCIVLHQGPIVPLSLNKFGDGNLGGLPKCRGMWSSQKVQVARCVYRG